MKLHPAYLLPALLLAGCSGGSADEAEAYKALEAKPMTAEQKEQMERIKGNAPNPGAAHAGATTGG
ncbi:hypothetical protein EON79_01015 [bacterium]|nr:MAG: hypothetical protein EON79_01015 [bacterium]